MNKKLLRYLLLAVILLLLFWAVNYVRQALPIANGYNAKMLCSCVFVAERKDQACLEQDLSAYSFLKREVDPANKKVSSSLWGFFKQSAVYRAGIGCSIYNENTAEKLAPVTKTTPAPTLADTISWPLGNKWKVHPSVRGVNYKNLREAVNYAFEEPYEGKKRGTRAVLIIHKDSVIAEQYAPGFDENTRFLGWSMTKSILNAVVGILVKDGKLNVEQKNLFPSWTDGRKNISIDDLLKMSSGLYFEEEYSAKSLATEMLFNSYSALRIPLKQKLENSSSNQANAVKKWYYSSGSSNLLSALIQEKSQPNTFDFLYQQLIYKIGMSSMVIEPDASGMWVGSSFTYATARDWAKFGLLYLHDGIWNNERILPEGWVKYTSTPAPLSDSLHYGAHFWMNASLSPDQPAKRWPELPNDLFYASGYQGQHVVIIPSLDLVIVRLGQYSHSETWSLRDFLRKLTPAFKS